MYIVGTNRKRFKKRAGPVFGVALASLSLVCGMIWGYKDDWVRFAGYSVAAIILATVAGALLVCRKLDERFDQLEERAKSGLGSEKDEKESKGNTDKS